jgi:hypothetical protein
VTDCERKPPTDRAEGGNDVRWGEVGMEIGCEVVDVTGVMSSVEDDRVDVPLDVDAVRFRRLPGDLFHRLRVNDGSARDEGEQILLLASQLAMKDARTLSRMRL